MFRFGLFQVLSGFSTPFLRTICHTRALRMPCGTVVRGETLILTEVIWLRISLVTCKAPEHDLIQISTEV